jgi:hypothetical protein
MKRTVTPLLAFLVSLAFVADAGAQALCAPRAQVVAQLEHKYREHATSVAVTAEGGALEVYVAPSGRTWTILITRPDGIACLVSHGDDWENLPTQVAGPLS